MRIAPQPVEQACRSAPASAQQKFVAAAFPCQYVIDTEHPRLHRRPHHAVDDAWGLARALAERGVFQHNTGGRPVRQATEADAWHDSPRNKLRKGRQIERGRDQGCTAQGLWPGGGNSTRLAEHPDSM